MRRETKFGTLIVELLKKMAYLVLILKGRGKRMRGHKREEREMCHCLENGERIEKIEREKSYTHNSNYNEIENAIPHYL